MGRKARRRGRPKKHGVPNKPAVNSWTSERKIDSYATMIHNIEHDHGHDTEGWVDPEFDEFFPGEGLHVTLDDNSD